MIRSKIHILVQPNAKKSEIVGMHGDRLKIKIHAPPVDGAANDEVVRFFAEILSLKKSSIAMSQGQTSKQKTIEVISENMITVDSILKCMAKSRSEESNE